MANFKEARKNTTVHKAIYIGKTSEFFKRFKIYSYIELSFHSDYVYFEDERDLKCGNRSYALPWYQTSKYNHQISKEYLKKVFRKIS